MKRPNKEKQLVRKKNYNFIEVNVKYTSDKLRDIANKMDKEGIVDISFYLEGYDSYLEIEYRGYETDVASNKRYKRECEVYERWELNQTTKRKKEKERLIKKAKSLGLVVYDIDNV